VKQGRRQICEKQSCKKYWKKRKRMLTVRNVLL